MNQKKREDARSLQSNARAAYEAGDIEDAYHLYRKAELLWRVFYKNPGDRVFFCQNTALRCLEELLEDRPRFYAEYAREGKLFLDEWSEANIKSGITTDHRGQALAFRLWRESNFKVKGAGPFHRATRALLRGDVKEANELLDAFIAGIAECSEDQERDYLLARAQASKELISVTNEYRKAKGSMNHSNIITGYFLAARKWRLPCGTASKQQSVVSAQRAFCLSRANMSRAFQALRRGGYIEADSQEGDPSPADVERSLIQAERYFSRAAAYAKKAASLAEDSVPNYYHVKLTYWQGITSERLYLIRYMDEGQVRDMEMAIEAWKKTLAAAKQIADRYGEEKLFPNCFYSAKDLEIEEFFLNAAGAFKKKAWGECITSLQQWVEHLPEEYLWSWRYTNILIRLRGAQAIAALQEGNLPDSKAHVRQLVDMCSSEPVGTAGHSFVDELKVLPDPRIDNEKFEATLNSLSRRFPVDAQAEIYDRPNEVDLFLSLPKRLYRGFDLPAPKDQEELRLLKADFLACLEAFLGYLSDYQFQSLNRNLERVCDLDNLLKVCKQLFDSSPRYDPSLIRGLDDLTNALSDLKSIKHVDSFAESYAICRGLTRKLLLLMPVIIRVEPSGPTGSDLSL